MKRITYISVIITALASIYLMQACKKASDPSHVVTLSFPVVTLLGPADTTISRNATWVDPGAKWKDTVTNESGIITISVNTSKDSAYLLVYTATNKNGFQSSVTRGLGVTNMNNNIDISGLYTDVYSSVDSIIKVSRALFYVNNVDLYGDPGVIVIKSDSTISVASILTQAFSANDYIPESFTQASIIYQPSFYYAGSPPHIAQQPPVIISYMDTALNVPLTPDTLRHN